MHKFASRIDTLAPSPTLALDAKVKALLQQKKNIINLGIGEPNFDTPTHVKKAAVLALKKNITHYTETAGILSLRHAIVEKLRKDNNIAYTPSEIIVGSGSKQILYEALQVLCDFGDEVIIPIPTWSTYVEQVKLAGGKPVLVTLKPPFKLTAADVEKKLTKKTKILMLNSPTNPTGAIIDLTELEKIAHLAIKHTIWVIADEIYEKIIYGTKTKSLAALNNKIKDQTITINGVSKAYAMTGWRIGYAAGPIDVIKAMTTLQGQLTSNASSIAQMAAAQALTGNQKPVEKMRKEFEKRRHLVIKGLTKAGLTFTKPEGAFYFFVSVENLLHKHMKTSEDFCNKLLEEENVALVPGEAFLYPKYFRLSFAASMHDLTTSMKRIARFVKKYA